MSAEQVSRRTVLKWSGAAGALTIGAPVASCVPVPPGGPGADENGVILPPGFTSRIIARSGQPVAETGFEFRWFPDGAATFVDPEVAGGWYYTVNHEIPVGGGVTAIRFAPDGTMTDAYPILSDTILNCAGGATPWNTWLSCEEQPFGAVFECDPFNPSQGIRRPQMGLFFHEAAAVAPDDNVYMTEDRPDGAFYRFVPDSAGDLSAGTLQVATSGDTGRPTSEGSVTWKTVPYPEDVLGNGATKDQVPNTLRFRGGEGIDTDGTKIWFSTKGDDRIWEYDLAASTVVIRFQAGDPTILKGVDNLIADAASDSILVAEDGGDMEIVVIRPDSSLETLVRLPGQDQSEVTGPTFNPAGDRLYFSSQRGQNGPLGIITGITYEITGPFDEWLGRSA